MYIYIYIYKAVFIDIFSGNISATYAIPLVLFFFFLIILPFYHIFNNKLLIILINIFSIIYIYFWYNTIIYDILLYTQYSLFIFN